MATKKEQLMSLILEADEHVIDALITLLQAQVTPLKFSERGADTNILQNAIPKSSVANYADGTQEFNEEIKNIFGF